MMNTLRNVIRIYLAKTLSTEGRRKLVSRRKISCQLHLQCIYRYILYR
jgi:hypothetical protein